VANSNSEKTAKWIHEMTSENSRLLNEGSFTGACKNFEALPTRLDGLSPIFAFDVFCVAKSRQQHNPAVECFETDDIGAGKA